MFTNVGSVVIKTKAKQLNNKYFLLLFVVASYKSLKRRYHIFLRGQDRQ